jgi:hypothetical protein
MLCELIAALRANIWYSVDPTIHDIAQTHDVGNSNTPVNIQMVCL